ncbi:MAG: hypothetical protein ACKOSQ_10485 [Planctomycetaceae bacterium]
MSRLKSSGRGSATAARPISDATSDATATRRAFDGFEQPME